MLRFLAFFLAIFLVGTTENQAAQKPKPKAPTVRLFVPAYFYPAGKGLKDWDRLFQASARVPVTAIVNPASGPGKVADPNYLKVLNRAKSTPIILIGYITTSYGKRPLAEVKKDVDTWLRLYPGIQGIFFDEQTSGDDGVAYMAELYKYVRSGRGMKMVVTNPGTICSEKYLSAPAADIVCLFEQGKAFDPKVLPAWVNKFKSERLYILSYKITNKEEMKKILFAGVKNRVGTMYITDAILPNPWNRLAVYWDELVQEVQKLNR